ncbi:MAG: ATP/GTP-binding protein [Nitrososphaeraceae archaeon]
MNAIIITGTAGSGKSLLTSRLMELYKDNNAFPISLNLDPGAVSLPYEPDVDVRDIINIENLMREYGLGPNGSLIMASDMISTRLEEIQEQVDKLNPDYVIVDSPGQIELFVFRTSGPYFVSNFQAENKVNLFTFDSILSTSPINFVVISLIATSVRLRLGISQIDVMTKRDLIIDKLHDILSWSNSKTAIEQSLSKEKDTQYSVLAQELLRGISRCNMFFNPILISNLTMAGMTNLSASLSRILAQGEEVLD